MKRCQFISGSPKKGSNKKTIEGDVIFELLDQKEYTLSGKNKQLMGEQ